ncbi:MAG TPA: cytochrome-c oxidase, cbb3-type subunit III [Casimicrobiaceae bacterium]|nr:cytochrome-c oxidase, cbb3-type subunit III [Casimicrobiaceae bacterium]
MSEFWSTWVILLIVVNLGIALFLFLWGPRVDVPTQPDGTSGHVWAHGVLREGVRRLPKWWIVMSALLFVVGFSYLALYPGFGAFNGVLDWTSHGELARAQAANAQLQTPLRDRLRGKSIEAIATDPEALRVGQMLFIDNCAACHGRDGHGSHALGAPDLTDSDWLYGDDGKSILSSIEDGRRGAMPAFAASLSDDDIANLAQYVASLSGNTYDSLRVQLGRRLFSTCAACHGADGKGNQTIGAPNLTDRIWLYGGNLADIAETIRHGRNGVMPAWRNRLGDENASLVAAWVYAQSHPAAAAAK